MILPDLDQLYAVNEATWPAASTDTVAGWIIRTGAGGGQRVSATTISAPGPLPDIATAEKAMAALKQPLIFMVRDGEQQLDAALAERGYRINDPVTLYVCPVADIARTAPPHLSTFQVWPPLAIMREVWQAGGVDAARLEVMQRATCPKTMIMGRNSDRVAGVAYVAVHHNIAMMHALEVDPAQRRQGVAINMMRSAAQWAQDKGATYFSLIVTRENEAANALYSSLNMQSVGHYHYRIKTATALAKQAGLRQAEQ